MITLPTWPIVLVAFSTLRNWTSSDDLESQQQYAAPQAAAPAPSGGMSNEAIEQLKQLSQLKDQGILTETEFEEQKHKLLYGG